MLSLGSSSGEFKWIESLHGTSVFKWVLLGLLVENSVGSDTSQLRLNLITVDDSGEISAGHEVSVEGVAPLFNTLGSVVSEDVVKGLEGVLGPDDESAEVTTWGELEEVQSVNVNGVNTWEISGGSLDEVVLISVNDEWASGKNVSGVSELSLAYSDSS